MKETLDEKYVRRRRAIEAMMNGATPIKCKCGVTHFEMPEEMRGIIKKCGNCGRHFDMLGPRVDKDV